MTKRAAHFLLLPELAHSPPNDALVSALVSLGYSVDLYAPGGQFDVGRYGPKVTAHSVEYGYRWVARNLFRPWWLRYRLYSGTTEDPMAVAGLLARVYRRPCITMADEIKSGSYSGNRSPRWKEWCRFGMRASSLTVVNEAERIELQREYAGLSDDQPVVVYPGCFREPPVPWDRTEVRRERGIPKDALVVCYSGTFNLGNGGLWLANALASLDDVWFWGQVAHDDALVRGLLGCLRGSERFVFEPNWLPWHNAWASMAAADIGMVVYLQDAPQFGHMGTASNRLCMFLSMGVPVIASRQPSFSFIEDFECGVLVDDIGGFPAAIERIAANLPAMRENARRCARDYIRAPERYRLLRDRVACLPSFRSGMLLSATKRAVRRMLRGLERSAPKPDPVAEPYAVKIRTRAPMYHREILHSQDGNDLVRRAIEKDGPLMVSRLGSFELACLHRYLGSRLASDKPYPDWLTSSMSNNAGFFPVTDNLLDRFSATFLEHVRNVDVMGVWFNEFEDVICNSVCGNADLVELHSLEPFHYRNPWSATLKGKTVLVVHPFVESIRKQYAEKRCLLFEDPEVLPDFRLKTVRAVQSVAGSNVGFATWFDAYRHMCDQISKEDFDVAIIGAGAYGLPLASFVKSVGKQAIHLGGVTQILFGIKGRRWETEYAGTTGKLFNEHWIRPSGSEVPEGYGKVEEGCYW